MADTEPEQQTTMPEATAKRPSWGIAVPLWVTFTLLLLASGYLSLSACGIFFWDRDSCAAPVALSVVPLERDNRALLAERETLIRRIRQTEACEIANDDAQDPELAACQPPPSDDILVLVDASASMKWDYDADPSTMERIDRLYDRYNRERSIFARAAIERQIADLERQVMRPNRKDRIDVAKDALAPLADGLPGSARIRLLSFAECQRNPRNEGTFGRENAADYRRAVKGITLRSETALASSIDQLPRLTEAGRSADRRATIVIVTDGKDVCGGDPCAAAARLKRQMPFADVSVVSVARAASDNACIAQATGGRFLEGNAAEELLLQLRRSVGQLSREECADLGALGGSQSEEEDPQ